MTQRYLPHSGQALPEGLSPKITLLSGGRGSGKTRAGAEWTAARLRIGLNVLVISDSADTIGSPSGVVQALGRMDLTLHRKPDGVGYVDLGMNGAALMVDTSTTFLLSTLGTAEAQDYTFDAVWIDGLEEKWTVETWSLLRELLPEAEVFVGFTPEGTRLEELLRTYSIARPKTVHLQEMTTFDNSANLSPKTIERLVAEYGGTPHAENNLYGRPTKPRG